jgi:2-iminoacetate synthase ThiH
VSVVARRPGNASNSLLQSGSAPAVAEALAKARDGERITDEDAVALLRSRDLVAVGRAAN